jgi:dihydroorotate dehydrogenase
VSFFWEKIARPALFRLDAEMAHELGLKALVNGLASPYYCGDNSFGFDEIDRLGLNFANPLGVAAGFDKNGVVINQLASLGFGFVEVGTVTYEPQPGNPKPRLFRLPESNALINRLGFNNDGAASVAGRLRKLERRCVVGVNIGKNKDVPNEKATENYLECFDLVYPVADYIAVNVSSPNTPGLRDLQHAENLDELMGALQQRNRTLSCGSDLRDKVGTQKIKPLLVKISPDLAESEIEAVVDVASRNELAGIIATNTTISRDALKTGKIQAIGAGGLSGKPLSGRANEVISTIFRYAKGKMPIIGVGGIFTPQDAFDKIAAGASLIQAYTGFVYGGPAFVRETLTGLGSIMKEMGCDSLDELIGSSHK